MSARGIELTLPDLPEVPIRLGPAPGAPPPGSRPPARWIDRLRDVFDTSLPLLLMAAGRYAALLAQDRRTLDSR